MLMTNKKSLHVVLIETHRSRKDNKDTKSRYRSILSDLISSDMHVIQVDYARLYPGFDIDLAASAAVDTIDDFFHNPYGIPSLDFDEDSNLDDIERSIRESQRMYSDNSQAEEEEEPEAYPEGKFMYVQFLTDKKLYEHICEILTEYGFEQEDIAVETFVSSYSSFSNFQRELMKPTKDKDTVKNSSSIPPGLLGDISPN